MTGVQLRAVLEQRARFGDHRRIAVERRARLACNLGAGVVLGPDIGGGAPLGLALDPIQRLVTGIHQTQKMIRPFLKRRGHGGVDDGHERQNDHQPGKRPAEVEAGTVHERRLLGPAAEFEKRST